MTLHQILMLTALAIAIACNLYASWCLREIARTNREDK
jgi:hypothetical protein